ncbi:MAG: RNA-binding protein [Beijerinckiaceae bacterium]|nr:RNA-binding protein [Beijerinckiaceae bacterium]
MTRGGRAQTDEGSQRTCIVTRAKLPPDELMRFVLSPDGEVVPDLKRKLPGRGVWVQATATAVAEAIRRKAFARGFKEPATTPVDLTERVDALLEKDALQSLSMANKAGLVTAGAFKVEAEIASQAPAALIHARDGSPDGARKLAAALKRRGETTVETPRIELFASAQLDLALGRANVIHAALRKGAASGAFLARCRRLALYRAGGMAEGAVDDDAQPDETQDG